MVPPNLGVRLPRVFFIDPGVRHGVTLVVRAQSARQFVYRPPPKSGKCDWGNRFQLLDMGWANVRSRASHRSSHGAQDAGDGILSSDTAGRRDGSKSWNLVRCSSRWHHCIYFCLLACACLAISSWHLDGGDSLDRSTSWLASWLTACVGCYLGPACRY